MSKRTARPIGACTNSHAGARCTVEKASGKFCDAPSREDAPFPICNRHAVRLFMHMREVARQALPAAVVDADRDPTDRRQDYRPVMDPLVYYLAVGDHIKIGFTTNLITRMKAYPPTSRLLAVEPGARGVEAKRHRQFSKDLAGGREYFHRTPELNALIATLRGRHPIPTLDGTGAKVPPKIR